MPNEKTPSALVAGIPRREYMAAAKRRSRGLPEPTRPTPTHCELCGGKPDEHCSLHLDHDHRTGKFRGWICSDCNLGLGKLGDTAMHLWRALNYLFRNSR
jgi:hypothetical protein